MTPQQQAIVEECRLQAESCQYTAAAMYEWLAAETLYNKFWNSLPIVFGALASFGILTEKYPVLASFLALLAGLLPSIYEKLELQAHTEDILSQAGQYKNLENRLKQAATIIALEENPEVLKEEFKSLMRRIEDVRARPLVVPEKYFQAGRAKVKDGRYEPDAKNA